MEIRIRKAGETDRAAVTALMHEDTSSSGEGSPLTEDYVSTYLASPNSCILLADTGEGTAGLLSYSIRPDLFHAGNSALIEDLFVREKFRNRGIGRKLVEAVLESLAETDCREVSVTVMPENRDAIRFYRRLGLVDEAVYLEKHFRS